MQQGDDAFPEELPNSGADRWAALFGPRDSSNEALGIGVDQAEEKEDQHQKETAQMDDSQMGNMKTTSGTSAGDSSTGISAGVGIAIGPDESDSKEVGCQANFPSAEVEESAAVSSSASTSASASASAAGGATPGLTEEEMGRITSFLQILRASKGPATNSTLQTLLKLLGSLPKPHGPRVLLEALRDEQPELFERLHESMRRTQQRSSSS